MSEFGQRDNPKSATCHPEREFYAKGMCRSCYYKDKLADKEAPRNPSTCHPRRETYAFGMCAACCARDRRRRDKPEIRNPATCHPEREHCALGLCYPCYCKKRYYENIDKKRQYGREWYSNHKEKYAEYNRRRSEISRKNKEDLWRSEKYGINRVQWLTMVDGQNGKCAICKVNQATQVDHDHITGKIRGALCPRCNSGLGHFKDDPKRLLEAIYYLSRNAEGLKEVA